jgi:hypothetical protein
MAGLTCENHPRIVTQTKDPDFKSKGTKSDDEEYITYFRNISPSSSRDEIFKIINSHSFVEENKNHHHRLVRGATLARRTVYYLAVGDAISYKIMFKPKFENFWRFSVRGFEKVRSLYNSELKAFLDLAFFLNLNLC